MLFEAGADLNLGTEYCRPPLVTTAGFNDLEMTKWLLERGADVNALGLLDTTAIMFAAQWSDGLVLDLLLNYRPELKILDTYGKTALDIAVAAKAQSNVEKLRRAGAKLATELK